MRSTTRNPFAFLLGLVGLLAGHGAAAQQVDRTVLPIPEPPPVSITELSARDVKPPARFEVKAPPGAPNVVVVLLDDSGGRGPVQAAGTSSTLIQPASLASKEP